MKDLDLKDFNKLKTSDTNENQEYQPRNKQNKQVIVLTSRVHPGESNASFLI